MSSPKAATRPARRAKPAADASVETSAADQTLSADAKRLADELERAIAEGRASSLSPEALHAIMGALCRTYGAQVEAGVDVLPLAQRGSVGSTEIMMMASALLRSANLAVFELGMWQSWTGR
jgi:hypothetical protein